MQSISRRDLLLLLLGVDTAPEGLGGITRLQKLLFLLEREEGLKPTDRGFEFEPYRAGPYSPKLYDDLEFLENLGMLESTVTSGATDAEFEEVDRLSFEHLMGSETEPGDVDGPQSSDSYEERRFKLSEGGRKRIEEMLKSGQASPVIDKIRRIKSKYGRYSLSDLLYYVYTKYPEMTTESEIRDQVLKRGQRR